MDLILEYWPLAATLALLAVSLAVLFMLRRQVNREAGDDTARLERALLSARKMTAEASRNRRPLRWARAQMQLAMLLTQAGGRQPDRTRLREALDILAGVIPVFEARRKTGERATALYYRGRAEWEIGMMDPAGAGLENAIATFRHLLALSPWPRHLLRSVVMTLPAVVLVDLGQRRDDRTMIEEGVALCREAVTIARRRIAVEWCITHRNLCHVLTALGRHTEDTALLEEAVTAGREAADAIRPSRDPGQWVASRICLGHALGALGELRGDTDQLQDGIAVLESVRRANHPGIDHEARMLVAQPLAGALIASGRLTGDRVALRRALQDLIVAQKVFDRRERDFARAETERMMGLALASLGAIEKDPEARQEADSHYRTALEIFGATGATRQVAETEQALRDLENGADTPPLARFTPFYTVR